MIRVKDLRESLVGLSDDTIVLIQSLDDHILKTISNISSTAGNLYKSSDENNGYEQEYVILSTHPLISRYNN